MINIKEAEQTYKKMIYPFKFSLIKLGSFASQIQDFH